MQDISHKNVKKLIMINKVIGAEKEQLDKFDARKMLGKTRNDKLKSTEKQRIEMVNLGQENLIKGVSFETMKYVQDLRHPRTIY